MLNVDRVTVLYLFLFIPGNVMTPRQRQNFAIEVKILKKIGRHNFVVEFLGLSWNSGKFLINVRIVLIARQ